MKVRLTQIDGKLPNLALMKLSHFHKGRGDEVTFTRSAHRAYDEQKKYDKIYASAIFNLFGGNTDCFWCSDNCHVRNSSWH